MAGWASYTEKATSMGGIHTPNAYTPVDLLRDLHFTGTSATFYVDVVANQAYQATVLSGNHGFPHNGSQFTVSGGTGGGMTGTAVTAQAQRIIVTRSVSEEMPLFLADAPSYGAQRSEQGRCRSQENCPTVPVPPNWSL